MKLYKILTALPVVLFLSVFIMSFNLFAAAKMQIDSFEQIDDIIMFSNAMDGFSDAAEASETLLKMYNTVKVNDSNGFIEIDAWDISGEYDDFNNKLPGTYTFEATPARSAVYDIDSCTVDYPRIRIIINECVKIPITEFQQFNDVKLSVDATDDYYNMEKAAETLLKEYSSVKVNGSKDTIELKAWKFIGSDKAYTPLKAGVYTFKATLSDSEKYEINTSNLEGPTINIVIYDNKSSVIITVHDGNNLRLSELDILISNDLNTYYGKTDNFGECIIDNVESGSYKISLIVKDKCYYKYYKIVAGTEASIIFSVSSKSNVISAVTEEETAETVNTEPIKTEKKAVITKPENLLSQIYNNESDTRIAQMETDSGLEIEISIDKMQEAEMASLKEMNKNQAYSEIQKVVDAVSTINFTRTSNFARKKIADLTEKLDVNVLPVNFTEHASFAFPIKLTVYLGKGLLPEKSDYILYNYNEQTNNLEECGDALVDENGILIFTISHCSDYFILDKTISLGNPSAKADYSAISEPSVISSKTTALTIESKTFENQADNNKSAEITKINDFKEAKITETLPDANTSGKLSVIKSQKNTHAAGQVFLTVGFLLVISSGIVICKKHKK